jgi:hypothetical protein
MFWKTWLIFTFKYPSRQCQSSNASYFFQDCAKLATYVPYTLMKFIWYRLPSRSTIAITSSSEDFTMHSFRLNCTFNLFDKILLTESRCVCNFSIWNTFLMQTVLTLSFICTSITIDFILIVFVTLTYHFDMFCCYRICDPLTRMYFVLHYKCIIIIIFDVICIIVVFFLWQKCAI